MQKLTRDRRELWGVSQGCFNPLRVRLTLLSEPDPSPPIHRAAACGCGHSRCYTNGAKAAPKRSRRSSPLGPATGARLLLDDDLNLDVCIGRHWRNHAVLLDEWALALLLARQRRRRRCSRLSPLPKALIAIDTDLYSLGCNTSIRHWHTHHFGIVYDWLTVVRALHWSALCAMTPKLARRLRVPASQGRATRPSSNNNPMTTRIALVLRPGSLRMAQ